MRTSSDQMIAGVLLAVLSLITIVFLLLDARKQFRRPDLYGSGGKYGRRSSTLWTLAAAATFFAAYLIYQAAFK